MTANKDRTITASDTETRMPLTSADVLGERMEQLKDLFPEAFVEGQIDFDRLRNALGDFVGEGRAVGPAGCRRQHQGSQWRVASPASGGVSHHDSDDSARA